MAWGGMVRWSVGPLFGQFNACDQRLGMTNRLHERRIGVFSADRHLLEQTGFGLAQGRGVAVTGVSQAGQGLLNTLACGVAHHMQAQMFDLG